MSEGSQKSTYYTHSGRAPAKGLILAIAGGAAASSLLALVYAYFDAACPFIYLNMVGTAIVGTVAGIVTGRLLVRGLVRNNLAAATAGAAVGLIALYVAWAAWPGALIDKPTTDLRFAHLLTSPAALWATITAINHQGAWKFDGRIQSGVVLWLAWAGEAAYFMGLGLYWARRYVASEPFCEVCQHWCGFEARVLETHGWDAERLKHCLESKDLTQLAALGPRTPNDVEWFRIDLRRCRGCGNTATLTAKRVELVSEDGKVGEKIEVVLDGLMVSGPEIERLRNFRFDTPENRGG